jgi:hypothetical protein
MADALADCYEESEEDAAAIDRIVDECCPLPPEIPEEFVPDSRIAARIVELLSRLAACPPEYAFAPLLWKLFAHPLESVRAAAAGALRNHLEWLDSAAEAESQRTDAQAAAPSQAEPGAPADGTDSGSATDAATPEASGGPSEGAPEEPGGPAIAPAHGRQLRDAESRSRKLSGDLEAARRQLTDERAQGARKDERLNQVKRELEQVQSDLRAALAAKAALEAERDRDTRALLRQRELEAEDLKRDVAGLRQDLEQAARREAALATRVRGLEAHSTPPAAAPAEAPAPAEEPASAFQAPEFTAEFYESIEDWDARVLKSAFEKALLLANDYTHPSLDAKPMQGADGLYRIRVATDVRLFYRRKPNGGIEVLSLIDRENLGRYVRQYKRRGHS